MSRGTVRMAFVVSSPVEVPPEAPEATPVVADPEPQAPPSDPEVAAPEPPPAADAPEAAAAPQIEVVEEKPQYLTVEQWEKEKADVAARAAAEALERDRRQRQTAEARRVNREKREAEERAETADIVRATLASRLGVDPAQIADETITLTIDRAASRKAQTLSAGVLDTVDAALDYLTAPAYGKEAELPEEAEEAAKRLGPKLQHLVNTIRPAIEAKAREGYIAESDLPARVDAEIARRAAEKRVGTDDLKRVEGTPAGGQSELDWWKSLGPEGRRDPANIARFDRYTASQR